MKAIIAGAGRLGTELAAVLAREGPVEQRDVGGADVRIAGRARRDPDPRRHASLGHGRSSSMAARPSAALSRRRIRRVKNNAIR